MRFVSERYPQLIVHDLRVRFVDGVADVDDPATIEALTDLADLGVRPADDDTDGQEGGGDPLAPPPNSASKAAWVSWVVGALGVEEAEAEAMTKAELIELAAGTLDDGQPDEK